LAAQFQIDPVHGLDGRVFKEEIGLEVIDFEYRT
jgi:hypothetical protein